MAGKTDINMAAPKETVTKMKSIFDSCSVDQLTGLKDMAELQKLCENFIKIYHCQQACTTSRTPYVQILLK